MTKTTETIRSYDYLEKIKNKYNQFEKKEFFGQNDNYLSSNNAELR